ncbi:hypothetical protein BU14_0082s0059 [Porphyra umbilicalis]|uniref:Uncharacterized protein n=1 Tax=Porphyra umbilicalis TaxID=2786 RepID=A0A1X6PEL0_PORUM|nr:hypothetical protein BU14_0082s0059 [Porphyra umbilicalis]|eukprot:OSX79294.1 hypothetical protein BU14_0082s0059 [Porphyra umbilicalis]
MMGGWRPRRRLRGRPWRRLAAAGRAPPTRVAPRAGARGGRRCSTPSRAPAWLARRHSCLLLARARTWARPRGRGCPLRARGARAGRPVPTSLYCNRQGHCGGPRGKVGEPRRKVTRVAPCPLGGMPRARRQSARRSRRTCALVGWYLSLC